MDAYELAYNYRLYAQDVKPKFMEAYRNTYNSTISETIEAWYNASPAYMKEVIENYKRRTERSRT